MSSVYTKIRTVGGGRRLVEFNTHWQRLTKCGATTAAQRNNLLDQIRHSLSTIQGDDGQEFRIAIFGLPGNPPTFDISIEHLPLLPPEVDIMLVESSRPGDPMTKATEWIRQREKLQENLPQASHINEIVLIDSFGNIYEGLSSNFGLLTQHGTLITAPLGKVLEGSIMTVTMQLMGMARVDRTAFPTVDMLVLNESPVVVEAAFITSTSRLILPVRRIYNQKNELLATLQSTHSQTLKTLQESLNDALLERSTPLW